MPTNTQFPAPGNTNTSGQIRKKVIRDALDAILTRPSDDPLTDKPATIAQKIALDLVKEAVAGDKASRRELIDRTDGKPKESIEHMGEDGGPIDVSLSLTVDERFARIIEILNEARIRHGHQPLDSAAALGALEGSADGGAELQG